MLEARRYTKICKKGRIPLIPTIPIVPGNPGTMFSRRGAEAQRWGNGFGVMWSGGGRAQRSFKWGGAAAPALPVFEGMPAYLGLLVRFFDS